MLDNEHRHQLKPIHSKIKATLKGFDKLNKEVPLVKLVEGFEQSLKDLNTEVEYCHKTAAVTMGPSCVLLFSKLDCVFRLINGNVCFDCGPTAGCHVLYVKFPELKTAKKKKDALSDLNQFWRDQSSNKLFPECLRKQLKAASLTDTIFA